MSGGHKIRRQPLTPETETETGVNERTPQISNISALKALCRLREINMPTSANYWYPCCELGTPAVQGGHNQEDIGSRGKKSAFDHDVTGSLDCGGTIIVSIMNDYLGDDKGEYLTDSDNIVDDTDTITNAPRKTRKPSKTSATDLVHSPPRTLSQSPPAGSAIPNS
ncbi:hypothetical protein HYFRA_00008349 [Hymenoscyphus fraxineus]|uniref:Uncharacterized protein n=1 Tax=Hymenoscyphus fraxineus TaxID=746836 RepID=A0A9N9KLV7_9HELO|nr:hypothetical protein HYFRA_00008349 [Hymenoscyphus fraxineus]